MTGLKGSRLEGGSSLLGDHLRDRVGLLCGESALLEREGGSVAGGVDVGDAAHAAVHIDRQEALGVVGKAADGWAPQARQSDGPVGRQRRSGRELQGAVGKSGGQHREMQLDPARPQQVRHGFARLRSEHLERLLLAGHDERPLRQARTR